MERTDNRKLSVLHTEHRLYAVNILMRNCVNGVFFVCPGIRQRAKILCLALREQAPKSFSENANWAFRSSQGAEHRFESIGWRFKQKAPIKGCFLFTQVFAKGRRFLPSLLTSKLDALRLECELAISAFAEIAHSCSKGSSFKQKRPLKRGLICLPRYSPKGEDSPPRSS